MPIGFVSDEHHYALAEVLLEVERDAGQGYNRDRRGGDGLP